MHQTHCYSLQVLEMNFDVGFGVFTWSLQRDGIDGDGGSLRKTMWLSVIIDPIDGIGIDGKSIDSIFCVLKR